MIEEVGHCESSRQVGTLEPVSRCLTQQVQQILYFLDDFGKQCRLLVDANSHDDLAAQE